HPACSAATMRTPCTRAASAEACPGSSGAAATAGVMEAPGRSMAAGTSAKARSRVPSGARAAWRCSGGASPSGRPPWAWGVVQAVGQGAVPARSTRSARRAAMRPMARRARAWAGEGALTGMARLRRTASVHLACSYSSASLLSGAVVDDPGLALGVAQRGIDPAQAGVIGGRGQQQPAPGAAGETGQGQQAPAVAQPHHLPPAALLPAQEGRGVDEALVGVGGLDCLVLGGVDFRKPGAPLAQK